MSEARQATRADVIGRQITRVLYYVASKREDWVGQDFYLELDSAFLLKTTPLHEFPMTIHDRDSIEDPLAEVEFVGAYTDCVGNRIVDMWISPNQDQPYFELSNGICLWDELWCDGNNLYLKPKDRLNERDNLKPYDF